MFGPRAGPEPNADTRRARGFGGERAAAPPRAARRGGERRLTAHRGRSPLGSRATRVLARRRDGMRRAARRVDRRSPRGVGTVTSRGASALGARSTERPSRARATHGTPGPVAGRFVRVSAFRGGVVPWAVSCHRSAWRIVRCLFGGEARQVTIVASRGSRRLLSSRMNVVCDDVVNSACTEVRRAGGSALERRGNGASDRDLERDCSIARSRSFQSRRFPRVSCRFGGRAAQNFWHVDVCVFSLGRVHA